MRMLVFSKRNIKEIIRDPITIFFGLIFPSIILILLSIINLNLPDDAMDLFEIEKLTPGICVFGLSFISLFAGFIISGDRERAFVIRLFSSPMTPFEFILGYSLPFIPIAILQGLVCFAFAFLFGLDYSGRTFLCFLSLVPCAVLYIGLGILFGSVFSSKQVGTVCGALLTNITAWLSGIWFPLDLMGETFKKICYALPFANAVDLAKNTFSGDESIKKPLLIVICYAVVIFVCSVLAFNKKMKE